MTPPDPSSLIEHLFIGGSRDGEFIGVPLDRAWVELPFRNSPRGGGPQPTEIYFRRQFNGETESHDVFILKGVSGNTAMRALIANYRPQPPIPAAAPIPIAAHLKAAASRSSKRSSPA